MLAEQKKFFEKVDKLIRDNAQIFALKCFSSNIYQFINIFLPIFMMGAYTSQAVSQGNSL